MAVPNIAGGYLTTIAQMRKVAEENERKRKWQEQQASDDFKRRLLGGALQTALSVGGNALGGYIDENIKMPRRKAMQGEHENIPIVDALRAEQKAAGSRADYSFGGAGEDRIPKRGIDTNISDPMAGPPSSLAGAVAAAPLSPRMPAGSQPRPRASQAPTPAPPSTQEVLRQIQSAFGGVPALAGKPTFDAPPATRQRGEDLHGSPTARALPPGHLSPGGPDSGVDNFPMNTRRGYVPPTAAPSPPVRVRAPEGATPRRGPAGASPAQPVAEPRPKRSVSQMDMSEGARPARSGVSPSEQLSGAESRRERISDLERADWYQTARNRLRSMTLSDRIKQKRLTGNPEQDKLQLELLQAQIDRLRGADSRAAAKAQAAMDAKTLANKRTRANIRLRANLRRSKGGARKGSRRTKLRVPKSWDDVVPRVQISKAGEPAKNTGLTANEIGKISANIHNVFPSGAQAKAHGLVRTMVDAARRKNQPDYEKARGEFAKLLETAQAATPQSRVKMTPATAATAAKSREAERAETKTYTNENRAYARAERRRKAAERDAKPARERAAALAAADEKAEKEAWANYKPTGPRYRLAHLTVPKNIVAESLLLGELTPAAKQLRPKVKEAIRAKIRSYNSFLKALREKYRAEVPPLEPAKSPGDDSSYDEGKVRSLINRLRGQDITPAEKTGRLLAALETGRYNKASA